MHKRKLLSTFLACFLLIGCATLAVAEPAAPSQPTAQPAVSDVIIDAKEHDGKITFSARSSLCLAATITLRLELENMRSSLPSPVTLDFDGKSLSPALELTPIDPDKLWTYKFSGRYHFGTRAAKRDPAADSTTQPAPPDYLLPYPPGQPRLVIQAALGKFSHFKGSGDEQCVDFAMPVGSTVCAARGGKVIAIKDDSDRGGALPAFKDSANCLVILHDDGTCGIYLHLAQHGSLVRLGQQVKAGDEIAKSGDTGWTTEPHLHFGVFNNLTGEAWASLPITFKTPAGEHQTLQEEEKY